MAFETTKYEVPTEMRDFAEKSVDQARKAVDGFITAAHKAVDTFQGSSNSMQSSMADMTKRTLGFAEENLHAAFEHAQKLVRARDLQEAVQLQTEFARSQFAAIQGQMKELGDIAQSAAKTATSHAASAANEAAAVARSATDRGIKAMSQAADQTTQH